MSKKLLALTLTGFLLFATGCSQMQFIATGKEFKSICESNGLTVEDVTDRVSEEGGYTSLESAYTAVPDDGAFTINYAYFSNSREAESYYSSITDEMDGKVYSGTNYKAEVEEDGDSCREIYMEAGRIVYAEGNTELVDMADSQLMSGWSKPGKVTKSTTDTDSTSDAEASDDAAAGSDTKSTGTTDETGKKKTSDTKTTKNSTDKDISDASSEDAVSGSDESAATSSTTTAEVLEPAL